MASDIALALVSLLAVALLVRQARARRPVAETPAGLAEVVSRLLAETRSNGLRYQVIARDQGEDHPDPQMRWQFLVVDADRGLRSALYGPDGLLGGPGQDPDGVLGVECPYWIANGPDEQDVMRQALAWIEGEGADPVFTAQPEGV